MSPGTRRLRFSGTGVDAASAVLLGRNGGVVTRQCNVRRRWVGAIAACAGHTAWTARREVHGPGEDVVDLQRFSFCGLPDRIAPRGDVVFRINRRTLSEQLLQNLKNKHPKFDSAGMRPRFPCRHLGWQRPGDAKLGSHLARGCVFGNRAAGESGVPIRSRIRCRDGSTGAKVRREDKKMKSLFDSVKTFLVSKMARRPLSTQ